MNCYADLSTIKSRLDNTGTSDDTDLLMLLNAASRSIDNYCYRWFYVKEETRYFDGSATPISLDDILSITTFKLDEDGDGTYESTMDSTDYILYPLNGYPKIIAKISGDSDYGGFASAVLNGVEIEGTFGYGDGESATPYTATAITIVADDATETELDVSAEGTIAAGHTIRVESEQIYVSAATSDSSNKITVTRAVNGTTGAAHATKTASVYNYPYVVTESTLIQAMRWYKRKDTAYGTVVGGLGMESVKHHGLDDDIKHMLTQSKYRKIVAIVT